jgi:DNA-nicking Smr family endonuclease
VSTVDNQFEYIFDGKWDEPPAAPEEKPPQQPQPQRKQKKNKSPTLLKLSPHRKGCPNENASFAEIRNMYSNCNDSCLWDLFVRCNGDADYCVNLLCDEDKTDQMDAGNDLTCACFGNDVTKDVEKVKKDQPQSSPKMKPKKAKTEAVKQVNFDEWLQTKEMIEKSITIGQEHYPDHVNRVKEWKNILSQPVQVMEQGVGAIVQSSSESVEDRQQLTIDRNLLLELDDEYGGGLLRGFPSDVKLPSKVFVRKSIACQLYLDIMEAYYAQEEENRLQMLKDDEELAKKLNEEENKKNSKQPEPQINGMSVWVNDGDDTEDMALKMSKEKLEQLFPGLNRVDLMEIFQGNNYNFDETVALIQDSLLCTPEERKAIAESKKKVFNKRWEEMKRTDNLDDPPASYTSGYTEEHLKTVEILREEIANLQEEQKACRRKAQEAIQKKQYETATYFTNVASLNKQYESEKTHEVANLMAGIHEKTHGTNSTTVDLHYHSMTQAETVLNNFLDRHIKRLREVQRPFIELSIITGKGTHSSNGLANIKIQTKGQIRDRKLQ